MLISTDISELSLKWLSLDASRVLLTELSKLRPIERPLRNARIVIYIAAAISFRRELAALGIAGGHTRLVGIVVTATAGAPHVLGLGAH